MQVREKLPLSAEEKWIRGDEKERKGKGKVMKQQKI